MDHKRLLQDICQYVKGISNVIDVISDDCSKTVSFTTQSIKSFSNLFGNKDLLIWKIELESQCAKKYPCFSLYYSSWCYTELRTKLQEYFRKCGTKDRVDKINSECAYVVSNYLNKEFDKDGKGEEIIFHNVKNHINDIATIDTYVDNLLKTKIFNGIVNKIQLDFDTSFSFTEEKEDYWKNYCENIRCLSEGKKKTADVEVEKGCRKLNLYQCVLYNDRVYIGADGCEHKFVLDQYLHSGSTKYASDSIIVSYRLYEECIELMKKCNAAIDDFERIIRKFIRDTYTIGGEIIFPKHDGSLNQERGKKNGSIGDRFDLTLESIKNVYDWMCGRPYNKNDPLFNVLTQKEEILFFGQFRDFTDYCHFFFLDGMLDDKGEIILFCDTEIGKPIPTDVNTYKDLIISQWKFVEKRNNDIELTLRTGSHRNTNCNSK